MLTRTSVVWADRIVADEQLPRAAVVELADRVRILDRQPSRDLPGPALRGSRFGHAVAGSFATVALVGSEPAGRPPVTHPAARRCERARRTAPARRRRTCRRLRRPVRSTCRRSRRARSRRSAAECRRSARRRVGAVRRHRHRVAPRRRLDDAGGRPIRGTATGRRRRPLVDAPARRRSPPTVVAGSTGGCSRPTPIDDAIAAEVGFRADRDSAADAPAAARRRAVRGRDAVVPCRA